MTTTEQNYIDPAINAAAAKLSEYFDHSNVNGWNGMDFQSPYGDLLRITREDAEGGYEIHVLGAAPGRLCKRSASLSKVGCDTLVAISMALVYDQR